MTLIRYLQTVIHLKPVQIGFQVLYRIWKPFLRDVQAPLHRRDIGWPVIESHSKPTLSVQGEHSTFSFLNKSKTFPGDVDWNFSGYGKLWTYHLNYFEFLLDKTVSYQVCHDLIDQYQGARHELKDGLDPYPISLRGVNWIKWFTQKNIHRFDDFLYSHYCLLNRRLEYHLLGNHLLENGFSLFFAAFYFQQKKWYHRGKKILRKQLAAQLLSDGGHFERSPTYHAIILERLLDSIQLIQLNPGFFPDQPRLATWLKEQAGLMLGWLEQMEITPGEVPDVNDSSASMHANITTLKSSARKLQIDSTPIPMGESGYRRIAREKYTALVDVGPIGPDYIPGHAHADSLNLLLYMGGKPVLVEAGTSTYENNKIRWYERSTPAHNTVAYDNQNSSEVWSAFRVAHRARTKIIRETENAISASHNGYKCYGVVHQRTWDFSHNELTITDEMQGKNDKISHAYFHFAESCKPSLAGNRVELDNLIMTFEGVDIIKIEQETYMRALAFNQRVEAPVIIVRFRNNLQTHIRIFG